VAIGRPWLDISHTRLPARPTYIPAFREVLYYADFAEFTDR
jgi:hypothetical protein